MTDLEFDMLPYRPCVGIALFNDQGQVWTGRRAGLSETQRSAEDAVFAWQMPQGGIDKGEEPLQAALRELYEETSIRSVELLAEARAWFSYDLDPAIIRKGWRGKYRGQTQKWFAFRFTGDDSEVEVLKPANGAHPAEFSDWQWRDLAETPDLIVPFKRGVYEQVVTEFAPIAAQLRGGQA